MIDLALSIALMQSKPIPANKDVKNCLSVLQSLAKFEVLSQSERRIYLEGCRAEPIKYNEIIGARFLDKVRELSSQR
jgi:hypothetical protein